jgi:hypothetical protein
VIVVGLLAALVVTGVGAQQATPTNAPVTAIPEKPPQFWTADGGTQASWMALRKRCADIRAELSRRQSLSDKQLQTSPGLSFSRDEMLLCFSPMMAAKAVAQPPSAAATPNPAVGIPETAPQWFIAEGSTQGQWTAIRENCNRNLAEMTRRGQLSAAQRGVLPPTGFSHHDLMLCAHLSVSPPNAAQTSPAPAPAGPPPTPVPTPLPPTLPVGP